jgi:ubiquinone/menaquinone biosynthesis C-methylase UbiE
MTIPDPTSAQVAYYDSFANWYDRYYSEKGWWADVEMAELLEHVAPRPNQRVADIGCGTGRITLALAPLVGRIDALDNSAASLDVLRSKCGTHAAGNRVYPAEAVMGEPLPLPDKTFDLVISCQAFMYVRPEERRQTLAEFARILRPGGRLLLEVFAHPGWIYRPDEPKEGLTQAGVYFRCYDANDMRQELSDNGWNVAGIHPIVRWPQLRRLGPLGRLIEMRGRHWGARPHTRCGYWLAEAVWPEDPGP